MDTFLNNIRASDVNIIKNGENYELEIPGFKFADFDRHGHLSLYSLSKYMEYNVFLLGKLDHTSFHSESYFGVIIGQTFSFCKDIYKNAKMAYPMKFIEKEGVIGKTSLSFNFELVEKRTGKILVTNERVITMLDANTRKPIPIPKKEMYRAMKPRHQKFKIQEARRPNTAYRYDMKAVFSDLDANMHVNAWSYIEWVSNAIYEASYNKGLQKLKGDHKLSAKKLELLYVNECFAGDEIHIYIWDTEETDDIKLNFEIEKCQETKPLKVLYGNIEFYDNVLSSNL